MDILSGLAFSALLFAQGYAAPLGRAAVDFLAAAPCHLRNVFRAGAGITDVGNGKVAGEYVAGLGGIQLNLVFLCRYV